MPSSNPTRITVEFDDGHQVGLDWNDLPSPLRKELERQPALSPKASDPDKDKYLVLTWADGVREVAKVDATCQDINRYYVISRLEEVGRLSLNKPDGYPYLVEINRRPQELESITFNGSFSLQEEKSLREGKKTDHFYSLTAIDNSFDLIKKELAALMAKENIDPEALAGDQSEITIERIRKLMDLRSFYCQQDVIDFLFLMIKSM